MGVWPGCGWPWEISICVVLSQLAHARGGERGQYPYLGCNGYLAIKTLQLQKQRKRGQNWNLDFLRGRWNCRVQLAHAGRQNSSMYRKSEESGVGGGG